VPSSLSITLMLNPRAAVDLGIGKDFLLTTKLHQCNASANW
jgi:hypothetical protein